MDIRKLLLDQPTLNEKDMILIETSPIDNTQCGVCGSNLELCVYRSEDGLFHKRVRCPKCDESGWINSP
jgi:hypothetical protein